MFQETGKISHLPLDCPYPDPPHSHPNLRTAETEVQRMALNYTTGGGVTYVAEQPLLSEPLQDKRGHSKLEDGLACGHRS